MSILLKWQEPLPILRSRLSDSSPHSLEHFLKRGVAFMLGWMATFVGYFLFGAIDSRFNWNALVLPAIWIFVNVRILQMLAGMRCRNIYEINTGGLVLVDGLSRKQFDWNDIKSYSFGEDKRVPGMSWLLIYVNNAEDSEHMFSFDPQEIAEDNLRRLLTEHLGAGLEFQEV